VVDFIWLVFGWINYSWWRHLESTVNKFWYLNTIVHGELWRWTVQGYDFEGVHLNGQAQNRLTPVMCTTGNFSDELNNKDIAKCAIGYLPTLIDLKAELEEHLLAIYGSKIWLAKEWQRS